MLQMTHTVQVQGTHYFRLALRWILIIVALLLVATILILSPLLITHAAGSHTATPTAPTQMSPHQNPTPLFRRKVS